MKVLAIMGSHRKGQTEKIVNMFEKHLKSLGEKDIIKYINTVCDFWGFNVCPGVAVTTPWGVSNPKQEGSDAERVKIHLEVKKGAERFYQVLIGPRAPEPSYKKLLIFRFVRSAHKYSTERKRDYQHFSEQGWLEKPYFYETKLSWPKRFLGTLIDKWQAK